MEFSDHPLRFPLCGGEFALGVGKGVGASLAFGTVDILNPSPNDTLSERAGEAAGTAVVGGLGTDMAAGGTTTAIATAPACATGAGCAIPATAAGTAVVGTVLAQGAAQNAAALLTTPIQMSSSGGDLNRSASTKTSSSGKTTTTIKDPSGSTRYKTTPGKAGGQSTITVRKDGAGNVKYVKQEAWTHGKDVTQTPDHVHYYQPIDKEVR